LASAVASLGSVQVRNRATLIGNICRASPSADTPPPLIADGAAVTIWSPEGERRLPLERFFVSPGKTVLGRGEIVTEVRIPAPSLASGRIYIKHGRRKPMELATVGVAVSLDRQDDVCGEVKIALGAVAPTPIRARRAEAVLRGKRITSDLIAQAADMASAEAQPISNVRASAAYRREMVGVLTRRAIEAASGAVQ
jgi:carbon-monoxide dehydrogenase medium subunit